jgi:pimeloyl-ACP methyl ester carboxylesterase
MRIVDLGSGPPLVVVPGIQGRWEWMKPAIDALARRCRVITFSLADEPSCRTAFDAGSGFSCYVDQVAGAMDQAGLREATICGVSYGGLIAAAFAARYPERTSAVVLVSAIPPTWTPDERIDFYLRAPRLLTPLFMIGALRMYPEIAAATPGALSGLVAAMRHGRNVLTHMFSPGRMARRVTLLRGLSLEDELGRLHMRTLVVTGEAGLDRVVPVARTAEYLRLWPHAQHVVLPRTGHLGLITRPTDFADIVTTFLSSASKPAGDAALHAPAEFPAGFDSIFSARSARLGPRCESQHDNSGIEPHGGPQVDHHRRRVV